jgi:hypothetical protein
MPHFLTAAAKESNAKEAAKVFLVRMSKRVVASEMRIVALLLLFVLLGTHTWITARVIPPGNFNKES